MRDIPYTHGVVKNREYRQYLLDKGFTKMSDKIYMYGNTQLNVCFSPCKYGVYYSADGGVTWTNPPMPFGSFGEFMVLVNYIINVKEVSGGNYQPDTSLVSQAGV